MQAIDDISIVMVNPQSHRAGMIGGKNWLFVRLTTDDGIVGWGEAYTQLDRDWAIARHIEALRRYLKGRSPFHIKHLCTMIERDFAGLRGSMDLYCALSAIEQAMWDIVGKTLGRPIYDLLGGPCRDRIRVYANGWYGDAKTPDDYARLAEETVARGFTALKFDPCPGPWRQYVPTDVEEQLVVNVRAVREAVGSEIDLLIEGHRRLAPMHAIRVAKRLEPLGVFWYEEPVPASNPQALAEVRAATTIPIVSGETLYTKADFLSLFRARAVDIINPDVCSCGGILRLREIAAMAEPEFVAVAPHNYNSTAVGLAATIQAAASMPNLIITEYFVNFEPTSQEIAPNAPRVEDGYIPLPKRPGLGIELDEQAMRRHPYQQQAPRALPTAAQEPF